MNYCQKKHTATITVMGPNGFGQTECYLCGQRHDHHGNTPASRKQHQAYCVLSGANRGLEVACPKCHAKVGQHCFNISAADWGIQMPHFHTERKEAAEALPVPDDFLLRLRAAFRLRAAPPVNYMLNKHWKGQGKVGLKR